MPTVSTSLVKIYLVGQVRPVGPVVMMMIVVFVVVVVGFGLRVGFSLS